MDQTPPAWTKGEQVVCGHWRWLVWFGMIAIACAISIGAQNPEELTEEQMRNLLLNGKVANSRLVGKGLTGAYRLTLSDGTMTHDGGFQSIDESRPYMEFAAGSSSRNCGNWIRKRWRTKPKIC
jgi:hypothetical protein